MTELRREFGAKDATRRAYLLRTFGISLEEYQGILDAQDGKCAICRREPGNKRFCVDHNHKTGQVRGLLCFRCNYGLTWYSDEAERLRAAAEYIAMPPAEPVIGFRVAPPKPKRSRRRRARPAKR